MAVENVAKLTLWGYRHVKFTYIFKSLYSCRWISAHKMKFTCPPRTAYFQKDLNQCECFSVSVLVEHQKVNLNKNFTFWRRLDSSVSELLTRVDLKLSAPLEKKLKKVSVNYEVIEVKSVIYRNGKQLPGHLLCSTLFDTEGNYILEILGDSYTIVFNSPWVNEITLPKRVKSNFVITPQKFQTSYTDLNKSSFKWYKSASLAAYIKKNVLYVTDWVEVGNDYSYEVQDEDVGHYLKFVCIPRNETAEGPVFMEVSLNPIVASSNDYNFVQTHLLTKEKVDNNKFRIVTYNVLATMYANTKEAKVLFDYCPPEVLDKDERYGTIAWEVAGYNADIICLQEADNSLHQGFLLAKLTKDSYGCSLCLKAKDKEGAACYYNEKKLNLIAMEKYVFGQEVTINRFLKDIYSYLKQNKEFFAKFCDLPHQLQMMVFEPSVKQDQLLIIGNVHLLSHPDADLTRLLQVMASFCLYEYTVEKLREKEINGKVSFILCGDFNSTPECSVNQMVMTGSIGAEDPIWSSDEMKGTKGITYKLPVKMDSAFKDIKYTNYTGQFKGCLDYIYYQSDSLEVCSTYPLPEEEVLSANVGLPSLHFPSDHLPLIADLQWKT